MLLRCYTQYASKYGKLSSGHKTGKGLWDFIPIPKKGNAKECSNYHTIVLISHASRVIIKILQARLEQYAWTENFQMFKLDLEKAEEPEINCQHLLDHRKSKRIPEKHLLLFHWLHQSLDCGDYKKLWKILREMGRPDHLTCLLQNL